MHDLASLAVPCLAWTRLRPNKVRARRGAGPGGPRRPAMGSSGAHRFGGAAVLAWTRLRPNKVRARRGAGPGGPRRPAMGSSGAHRFGGAAVLAWTRLRPNKVRARRGAGPGGPRRPAMGSSGAHRFDGAAVTWRSMGWRRRVVGARACHRRCRVIRPKFTDTGTSSALMHARGRGRLGRSSPPSPFRGARPCPRAARGCPPAPARLERVRHHIGGSF
jgi:hypothetical protein